VTIFSSTDRNDTVIFTPTTRSVSVQNGKEFLLSHFPMHHLPFLKTPAGIADSFFIYVKVGFGFGHHTTFAIFYPAILHNEDLLLSIPGILIFDMPPLI
jgi:hypothetical protein